MFLTVWGGWCFCSFNALQRERENEDLILCSSVYKIKKKFWCSEFSILIILISNTHTINFMQMFVRSLRQNQLFDWLVSSPESNAQVSFSDQNLSAVRSCRHKLFTFFSSSPQPLGQFQPNLARSILGWIRNEHPNPIPRGDQDKIAKIHWQNLKSSLSRATRPISTKFGTF